LIDIPVLAAAVAACGPTEVAKRALVVDG